MSIYEHQTDNFSGTVHGQKWSKLGFAFGPDEIDKQITVKKANKVLVYTDIQYYFSINTVHINMDLL